MASVVNMCNSALNLLGASTITALTDAVIDSSECTTNITDIPATLTIPKGVTIYGDFTSIELDSGTIVAYIR